MHSSGLWVRGRAKDGPARFYRVATAYVMRSGWRVTLAIHFVLPEDDIVSVLHDLLKRLHLRAIQVTRLFLDKGFDGIAVMDYLIRRGQPALIACTIRGKQGGIRALCVGHESYCPGYTFERAEHGQCSAQLAVYRVFTTAQRNQRLKRRAEC